MNRFLMLLALLSLSGCTSINYKEGPVAGLEHMKVEEYRVDAAEIYQRCSKCGSLGLTVPQACTCINFRENRAVIWLAHNASDETIEHERAHGRGYDHTTGELREQYTAWVKKTGEKAALASDRATRTETVLTKVSLNR